MRKNEYTSLEDFTSQYTGEWSPSDGHWLGLDFIYKGVEYRFHTGRMYDDESSCKFAIYRKMDSSQKNEKLYDLLKQFDSMEEVLNSTLINNQCFSEVIMDDDLELVGQD